MDIGDIVRVKDGSYTLKISENSLVSTNGLELGEQEYILIAQNCSLPADNPRYVENSHQLNNAIIKGLKNGQIVFIQARFLEFTKRYIPKCLACGK